LERFSSGLQLVGALQRLLVRLETTPEHS
jgi:hypothetical protein